ncbi:AAA family ATPase [Desulfococcaceae bacterium HSG8]|nr:AAA family ATPase [Desulfococcaceae bacterium HSG8]
MTIKRIRIRNFKVFKDACVKDLGKMNVFLGINGSGKTTLFDVFGFLTDALQNNMTVAINRRGGFSQVLTRGCNIKTDSVSIEIEFTHIDGESFNYSIEIAEKLGKAIIKSEILKKHGDTLNILDFHDGKGTVLGEHDMKPTSYNTASPDILAIKGLGQFERFKAISSFRALLEKCYISNFRIEYGRNISDTGLSEHLSATGDNLAQVTKYMYEYHPELFGSILEKLPLRIPGVNKVEAKETEDGRIVLRFQDEHFKDPFVSRYVSDGTIKMFACMILLYDPEPHPLLCIEEPENFFHPDLLPELCEEIRGYADRGGQIFVSTHSPDFVNGVRIDELYYLEKENGYTQIKAVRNNDLIRSLSEKNQLGWLWRNHYIQGASLK